MLPYSFIMDTTSVPYALPAAALSEGGPGAISPLPTPASAKPAEWSRRAFLQAAPLLPMAASSVLASPDRPTSPTVNSLPSNAMQYRTVQVDGLDIFYRETGDPAKPTLLLLHGYPTSSFMFRNLMPALAARYHLVAPDYPGFGQSSFPDAAQFAYTFDNLARMMNGFVEALQLTKYSLYIMDYGVPVGLRLASQHPERVQALVIQNGNAYDDGIQEFWNPLLAYWKNPQDPALEATIREQFTLAGIKAQYLTGVRNPEAISPDTYTLDWARMSRPGNVAMHLAYYYDYRHNVTLYPVWQAYFRKYQPPTLLMWGKNDPIFPVPSAKAYTRDLKTTELHLLDTGHFALEEEGPLMAALMDTFLTKHLGAGQPAAHRH